MIKCFLLHIFVGVLVFQEINAKASWLLFVSPTVFPESCCIQTYYLIPKLISVTYLGTLISTIPLVFVAPDLTFTGVLPQSMHLFANWPRTMSTDICTYSLEFTVSNVGGFFPFFGTFDMIDTRHGLVYDHTCKNLCWMRHMKSAKWLQT